MSIDEDLVADILHQLQNDILHFGWMVNMVKRHQPDFTEQQAIDKLLQVVVQMHADGQIVVGQSNSKDGVMVIDAWPEKGQQLLERLVETIGQYEDLARDFCFWIEDAKHHR